MKKEIQVVSVNLEASGTTNNREWKRWKVQTPDISYGSFCGEKYVPLVGQKITVEVEEVQSKKINEKTGKPWMNWMIIEPKKYSQTEVELLEKVSDHEKRLKALEEAIRRNLANLPVQGVSDKTIKLINNKMEKEISVVEPKVAVDDPALPF